MKFKLTQSRILFGIAGLILSIAAVAGGHWMLTHEEEQRQEWIENEWPALSAEARDFIDSEYDGEGRVAWSEGTSMRPTFKGRTVVVVIPTPFEEIEVGDIVEVTDPDGQTIHHRVSAWHGYGFRTKGDNNREPDEFIVTRENYHGEVVQVP